MANDESRRLFPTSGKAKIGKEYSWTVGAELLSAALFDTPQSELIKLEFAEADRVSLRKSRPPLILDAEYYYKDPTLFFPSGSPLPQPRWRLVVRAVPREWRHSVKTLLIEHGLPQIVKPWLIRNSGPSKREGNVLLRVWYGSVENRLIHRSYGNIGPALVAQT